MNASDEKRDTRCYCGSAGPCPLHGGVDGFRSVHAWFQKPWDRCRVDGKVIWTKDGYTLCAKHGGR